MSATDVDIHAGLVRLGRNKDSSQDGRYERQRSYGTKGDSGYDTGAPTTIAIVILVVTIVLSSVVSHAPARVRYYSIFHGREIDTL